MATRTLNAHGFVAPVPVPAAAPSVLVSVSAVNQRPCPPNDHSSPSSTAVPVHSIPRLNDCDFLVTVLECYMVDTIRCNEDKERTDAVNCYRFAHHTSEPSVFHALQAPSITPIEYLRRLARYSFCSRSVFVAAFFYLDRIARMDDVDLRINSLSVHRLLLTAVLLATKMIDDVLYDNAHFAKVGGLDVKELNMLELDMLKVLNFKLFIKPEEFEAFEEHLLERAMSSRDPDFMMLPGRLRNLGYGVKPMRKIPLPSSPASTMDVCFSAE